MFCVLTCPHSVPVCMCVCGGVCDLCVYKWGERIEIDCHSCLLLFYKATSTIGGGPILVTLLNLMLLLTLVILLYPGMEHQPASSERREDNFLHSIHNNLSQQSVTL